jgi:hypothetical protein
MKASGSTITITTAASSARFVPERHSNHRVVAKWHPLTPFKAKNAPSAVAKCSIKGHRMNRGPQWRCLDIQYFRLAVRLNDERGEAQ